MKIIWIKVQCSEITDACHIKWTYWNSGNTGCERLGYCCMKPEHQLTCTCNLHMYVMPHNDADVPTSDTL